MNLYWRELKANRKSLILWGIGMVAMIGAGMGKFAGFQSSGQSMNDLIAQMPKSLQSIMGTGTLDISTASGYYGVLFMYLLLIATIHAALIGATIISKEERDKTVEFLFVKPVTRKRVIFFKLLAALTNIVILTIITWISSLLIVGKYSDGESVVNAVSITMAGMFILQLLFLGIGTAIAALTIKPEKASSVSTGILLITFLLSVAIDLSDKIESLKYFTPFKYFEAKKVMYGGGFEVFYIVLSLLIIVVCIGITFVFYPKRDLHV